MSIRNHKDLMGILKTGQVVARIRDLMKKEAKPGVSTYDLDQMAKQCFEMYGAKSAPMFDYQFPGYTCISINHEIAHGIPKKETILRFGDLVNIDVSATLNGYYADTGISFVIGNTNNNLSRLCDTAVDCTGKAIQEATTGNPLRMIGKSIHQVAKANGFTVIKNLAGHGTGKKLHEEPEVLVYEEKRDRRRLSEGLVLAIESFVSTKSEFAVTGHDGWTLTTKDKSFVAQCEHTVIVSSKGAIVATQ
ncbi:methionyl aminopeptidase [Leptospira ryugenii]|uniref:Methionine aminopeptidase n=1 Tax=Leptospira ryugenii TaxID=1917863 RepID=A0A2P2E471_9LEPT|nr:type I methionyl aminopeptidase [Leptospira ryugenii]GBF51679.1 methionyl aminopeptidase [Leptospira ryugenii]